MSDLELFKEKIKEVDSQISHLNQELLKLNKIRKNLLQIILSIANMTADEMRELGLRSGKPRIPLLNTTRETISYWILKIMSTDLGAWKSAHVSEKIIERLELSDEEDLIKVKLHTVPQLLCSSLSKSGFVTLIKRGVYKITPLGIEKVNSHPDSKK